jgi:hypothetical protein
VDEKGMLQLQPVDPVTLARQGKAYDSVSERLLIINLRFISVGTLKKKTSTLSCLRLFCDSVLLHTPALCTSSRELSRVVCRIQHRIAKKPLPAAEF